MSAKTVKNYLDGVLKLQEAGKYSDKERNINPITSIQKLVSKEMRELIEDIKYSKKDYKRGASKEGYSYEEAKIIERKISFQYGEEFRLMIRVFIVVENKKRKRRDSTRTEYLGQLEPLSNSFSC